MGALLNDGGTFAIVFADHDQRTTDHAGRSQIRQSIRRDIRADDGFPSDRAAQGVVDAGTQHRRR